MADQDSPDDPFDAVFRADDDHGGRRTSPSVNDRNSGHTRAGHSGGGQPQSRRAAREAASAPSLQQLLDDDAPDEAVGTGSSRSSRRRDDASGYPPREKRSKRGLIAFVVVLVTLGAIAAGGLYVWNTFEPQIREVLGWQEPNDYEGIGTGEVLVSIDSGDTGADIATRLQQEGVTKTYDAFYDLLVAQPEEPVFHPGVYRLAERMSAQAALDALLDPANKIERTALIREGITTSQILEELSTATELPVEEFQAAVKDPAQYGIPADAPSIEGWLFPAQYTFDPGVTATDAIQTLVNRTVESLDSAGVPVEDRQRILTIASVIEREARLADDFYRVSRVIQNRLAQDMALQMDSTAQYGIQAKSGFLTVGTSETVWSTEEALSDDNAWNTYVHTGLPAGPISSPGDTAIDAAMHPADGPWIFFVTVNLQTGETVFSETNEQHESAVAQLREWCSANPGQGC
ncbi:endolytic transglycosylase MltG [Okibacterium endophyticum]